MAMRNDAGGMSFGGAANPESISLPGSGPDVAFTTGSEDDGDGGDGSALMMRIRGWFQAARASRVDWRRKSGRDYDFVAGRQWSAEDEEYLRAQGRPTQTFNRIAPFVNGVCGQEVNNRFEVIFLPRRADVNKSDEADLANDVIKWARDETHGADEESESFRDLVTCGEGWVLTEMSYLDNPDGMIQMTRVDPMDVYPDPGSKRKNYADARFLLRVHRIDAATALELYPDFDLPDLDARWAEIDVGHVEHTPEDAFYRPREGDARTLPTTVRRITMVEAEWFDYETRYRVTDPATGETGEMSREDFLEANAVSLRNRNAPLDHAKVRQKIYSRAVVGNVMVRLVEGNDRGGFALKAMTARRDRRDGWYGLVRDLVEPQEFSNKMLSMQLYQVQQSSKGGWLVETGVFVDPENAADDLTSPGAVVELVQGGLDRIRSNNDAPVTDGAAKLMQLAIDAIPTVAGLNLEILGQQTNDQANVLEVTRAQKALAMLAEFFDALRRYRRDQSVLMLYLIQEFVSDGRMIQIGDPITPKTCQLLRSKVAGEYDLRIDDSPTSQGQRAQTWGMIVAMMPMLQKMQVPPSVIMTLLQFSPLPGKVVHETMQAMTKAEQAPNPQQQMAQRIQTAKASQAEADAALKQAQAHKAAADVALAEAKHQWDSVNEPQKHLLKVQQTEAQIELARANAVAILAKSGIDASNASADQLLGLLSHANATQQAAAAIASQDRSDALATQQLHLDRQQQAHEQQMAAAQSAREDAAAGMPPAGAGQPSGAPPQPPPQQPMGPPPGVPGASAPPSPAAPPASPGASVPFAPPNPPPSPSGP